MPSVVSTASSSRMAHHAVSQADLDVLALLTSDESSLGPLPTRATNKPQQKSKRLAQRESPMDALLISAVLTGSDPLTRHHFGHGAGRPLSSCNRTLPRSTDNQLGQEHMHRATSRNLQHHLVHRLHPSPQ